MPANPHELSDISELPAGDTTPSIDPETNAALDDLLRQSEGTDDGVKETPTVIPLPKTEEKKEEVTPPPPPATPPPSKFVEEPGDSVDAAKKAGEAKEAEDKKAVESSTPTSPPAPKDELDSVALPPYSKPKTGEAFAEVKRLAREKLTALEKDRDEIRAKASELEKKLAAGLPKEVQDELNELRRFRSQLDVASDPEFRKYDVTVAENTDSIYSRLRAAGFTEETIGKIRQLGGPADVDWEALAEKIPPQLKRFIDSKLVENESIVEKKARAVKAAQEHADEYIAAKATEEAGKTRQRLEESGKFFQEFLPKVPWLAEQTAKVDATAEEKAEIARHNKLVSDVNSNVQEILKDETPAMRAIMAVNYAQHLKLKTDHGILKTKTEAQIKDLTAKLAEANDLLERVKKNSTNRLRNTPAVEPAEGERSPDRFDEHPGTALDTLFKTVTAS